MNGYNLTDIETMIEQIPDQMRRQIIKIEWQDATTFERQSQNLQIMTELMQLDTAQIDGIWSQALSL